VRVDEGVVPGARRLVADLKNVDERDRAIIVGEVLHGAGDFREVGAVEGGLRRRLGIVE
jgi:hypothetical protein